MEYLELLSQYVIVPLIIWGLTELHRFITAKVDGIKDENVRKALHGAYAVLDEAARSAVAQTEVEFVKMAKKYQRWDDEAKKEAKERALDLARRISDEYSYRLVQESTGHANEYIRAKIDEIIQGGKP